MEWKNGDYNLVVEDWIPVVFDDGTFRKVGIWEALVLAGRIRRIAASNPLDNASLFRFLLAILYWCRPEITREELDMLQGASGVPAEWLERLGTPDSPFPHFNLLGDGPRFFQTAGLKGKEKKAVGYLLTDLPTETSIAHFRHVRDGEYGICPACCAMGMIRFCSFAHGSGRGYSPGINGAAPTYVFAETASLLDAFRRYWTPGAPLLREPPWINPKSPGSFEEIDIPTLMAWRPRSVWLGEPDDHPIEECSYCGEKGRLIRKIGFSRGWKPPARKNERPDDPHLVGISPAGKAKKSLSLPHPIRSPMESVASFWRHSLVVLRQQRPDAESVVLIGALTTRKGGLYQDALEDTLSLSLSHAESKVLLAVEGMKTDLKKRLKGLMRNRNSQILRAAADTCFLKMESELRSLLENGSLLDEAALTGLLKRTFEETASLVLAGLSTFRRGEKKREMTRDFERLCAKHLKDVFEKVGEKEG